MAKPNRITITELATKSNSSRSSLFKKCSRANKKKDSLIYVNGSGWYSITKPGKTYILYLISADSAPKDIIKKEVENNIIELIDVVNDLVCEDCNSVIKELKDKII